MNDVAGLGHVPGAVSRTRRKQGRQGDRNGVSSKEKVIRSQERFCPQPVPWLSMAFPDVASGARIDRTRGKPHKTAGEDARLPKREDKAATESCSRLICEDEEGLRNANPMKVRMIARKTV